MEMCLTKKIGECKFECKYRVRNQCNWFLSLKKFLISPKNLFHLIYISRKNILSLNLLFHLICRQNLSEL